MPSSLAADRVGSFATWFDSLHCAVRRQMLHDAASTAPWRLGENADDDAAAVAQLYVAVRSIPTTQRDAIAAAIESYRVVPSGQSNPRTVPLLSVMDVLEVLEHCQSCIEHPPAADGAMPVRGSFDILFGALEEDATKVDLRLLLSLLRMSNDGLQACERRVLASSFGGTDVPSSPRPERLEIQPHDAPRPAKRIAFDEGPASTLAASPDGSPVKTRGPRIDKVGVPRAAPVATPTPPVGAVGGRGEEDIAVNTFLWSPALSASAIDAKYTRFLGQVAGTDALPPGPFDPQHPQRVMESTPQKLVKRMLKDGASNGFFADLKYDGERLLGFKETASRPTSATALPLSSSYRFFSRNMLPVPERKLDQIRALLDAAFGSHSVVFDAEILSMHTFGSMNEVHKGMIALSGPRVYVFDLLWLNGHSLVSLPLDVRKVLLSRVLTATKNVTMTKCFWIPSGLDAERRLQLVFEDAMSKRLEGYVLKPASSLYRFNGTDWVKLKKGYMVSGGDDGTVGGPSAFSLFPGGPRIRRVDGVAVTTLLHGPGAGGVEAATTAPIGIPTAAAPHHTHASTEKANVLFCKLVDTLDCVVLGTRGDTMLCGVLDAASSVYVTVGYARDPTHAVRLDPGTLAAFSPGGKTVDCVQLSPALTPPPQYVVNALNASSIVVEVCAGGLVRDARHSCGSVGMTEDARIVRVRSDKDVRCTNTKKQVLDMFDYAVPMQAVGVACGEGKDCPETTPLAAALKAFNDQHWVALPSTDVPPAQASPAPVAISVSCKGISASAAAKNEAAAHAGSNVLQVVVIPVAPRKRWIDKGVMKDATAHLGPEPSALCNTVLGIASASSGDVVAVAPTCCGGRVLCVVAALVQLVSMADAPARPVLDDIAILDIVLVRLVGALCALLNNAADVHAVAVHVDIPRHADEPIWRQALTAVLSTLPHAVAGKFRCTLHATTGRH